MEVEISSIKELNKLCRLCLSSSAAMCSIYDIMPFDPNEDSVQFADVIMECTSVDIQSNDELPDSICDECMKSLSDFYMFKEQCEKCDFQFHQLLEVVKKLDKTDKCVILKGGAIMSPPDDKIEDNLNLNPVDEMKDFIFEEKFVDTSYYDPPDFPDDFKAETKLFNNVENLKTENRNIDLKETHKIIDNIEDTKESLKDLKNKKYQCAFCFKRFRKSGTLIHHENNYCKNKIFSCDVCFKTFKDVSIFHEHLASEHKQESKIKIFECDVCNERLTSSNKLLLHYQLHIATSGYFDAYSRSGLQCYICEKEFKTIYELKTHSQTHQGDKSFHCKICDTTYDTHSSFKDHLKLHGIRPFICNQCLIGYHFQSELIKHIDLHSKHTTKTSFSCALCNNTFGNKQELKLHLKYHSQELYKCAVCTKACGSLPEITLHYNNHENPPSTLCPICGVLISKRNPHTHTESEMKSYPCEVCKKEYKTKENLKKHMRIHDNYKPYVCSYCGYRSCQSNDLTIHMRTHTGVRPYPCQYPGCDKAFKTSSHRIEHMRRHTGEKNHKCTLCGKAYGQSYGLKQHMRVHLNIRPHDCNLCGMKFQRKYRLREHMNKAHGHLME